MTTALDRVLRQASVATARPLARALESSLGTSRERLPAKPGTPGETHAEWLQRLGWIRIADERLRVTALGEALMRHLEQESLDWRARTLGRPDVATLFWSYWMYAQQVYLLHDLYRRDMAPFEVVFRRGLTRAGSGSTMRSCSHASLRG